MDDAADGVFRGKLRVQSVLLIYHSGADDHIRARSTG